MTDKNKDLPFNKREIANDDTFSKLNQIASEKTNVFLDIAKKDGYQITQIDKLTTELVAGFVNQFIPFSEEGVGNHTIQEQLLIYNKNIDSLPEMKKNMGCKLPTVITGLILSNIAIKLNINIQEYIITTKKNPVHPYLAIKTNVNQTRANLIVDFHLQGTEKSNQRVRDAAETSLVNLDSAHLNILDLNTAGLSQLDKLFLESLE